MSLIMMGMQRMNNSLNDKRDDHGASCLMAFQFLTRLPVPSPGILTDNAAGRSLLYYPVVGIAIAFLLALSAGLMNVFSPQLWGVQAFVVLVLWVFLTGGLHLDGLADSADAWVGGLGDRTRTLAIMKDPYAGPAAVAVVVLVLLGKWVLLTALLAQSGSDWWMAPVIARIYVLFLMTSTPYAREGGLGQVLSDHCCKDSAKHLLIFALVMSCFMLDFVVIGLTMLVFAGLRWLMIKRLGGTTGDTAGASIEILEWTFLLAVLVS